MAINAVVLWNYAELFSAVILLAALALMAKFYEEYLEASVQEMNDWKLITIGFAFYIAIKTHFTILAGVMDMSISSFPIAIVGLFGATLIVSSAFVFLGFYGLVKDYL